MNPIKYFAIWAGLLFLLALTWGMAQLDLGALNLTIAMLISLAKMALVVLFFMHLRFSTRLTWLFASAGSIWLLLMMWLTLTDYFTRTAMSGTAFR